MDQLKAFFARDAVKIIAGGIFVVASGLLGLMAPSPTKDTLMLVWTSVITPLAIYLGITSGGTWRKLGSKEPSRGTGHSVRPAFSRSRASSRSSVSPACAATVAAPVAMISSRSS